MDEATIHKYLCTVRPDGDVVLSEEYISSPQTNPIGPESGEYHVFRGGGWNDEPVDCRVSTRGLDYPEAIGIGTGFRLVLVP